MVALIPGKLREFVTDCPAIAELLINEYPEPIRDEQYKVERDRRTGWARYHFYNMDENMLRVFIKARHLDDFCELEEERI